MALGGGGDVADLVAECGADVESGAGGGDLIEHAGPKLGIALQTVGEGIGQDAGHDVAATVAPAGEHVLDALIARPRDKAQRGSATWNVGGENEQIAAGITGGYWLAVVNQLEMA